MEARRDPPYIIRYLSNRIDLEPVARREYRYLVVVLRSRLHTASISYWISSVWRWSSRPLICGISKGLGQETFVPLGNHPHYYQQRMGRRQWA